MDDKTIIDKAEEWVRYFTYAAITIPLYVMSILRSCVLITVDDFTHKVMKKNHSNIIYHTTYHQHPHLSSFVISILYVGVICLCLGLISWNDIGIPFIDDAPIALYMQSAIFHDIGFSNYFKKYPYILIVTIGVELYAINMASYWSQMIFHNPSSGINKDDLLKIHSLLYCRNSIIASLFPIFLLCLSEADIVNYSNVLINIRLSENIDISHIVLLMLFITFGFIALSDDIAKKFIIPITEYKYDNFIYKLLSKIISTLIQPLIIIIFMAPLILYFLRDRVFPILF